MIRFLLACGPKVDDVVQGLSSRNPVIREDSAIIAGNTDDIAVVPALVSVLEDPSSAVQLNAIESLIKLGATDAVPSLMELVASEQTHPEVRLAAIDGLGRLGDVQAVPVLVLLLQQTPEAPPLSAIWALGNLGDAAALEVLSGLLVHPDPYVAFNATKALRQIRP